MADADKPWKCFCGKEMQRDFQVEAVRAGGKDYRRAIVSDSLAVSPKQIEQHKKLFPDIKITSEGQPVFDSYKKHQRYLDQCGFIKHPAKRKRKGKKII